MSKKKSETEKYMRREKGAIFTTTVVEPVLKIGQGVLVSDVDGKIFIDFTSQISLLNTGYRPGVVMEAIKAVIQKGIHSCISADWPFKFNVLSQEVSRAALAEKLIKISNKIIPFRKRVMFEVSGATAINAAGRIAAISYLRKMGEWNTEKFSQCFLHKDVFVPSWHDPFTFSFLAFKNAFHGRHGLAKLLTDSKAVHYWGPSSSCAVGRLNFPRHKQPLGNIREEVEEMIMALESFAPVIAFVFEPVQGEGGFVSPDADSIKYLVEYLRNKGIYIIADEIQTGLGRTGKMFACEHFGIQPDMVVLSKSLAAGLPMGAVIADAEKFKDLEPGMHSGSMHCSPIPCAAAIANLETIKENISNSAVMGVVAASSLTKMWKKYPNLIQDVRGLGLMIGIEFFTADDRNSVLAKAKENGLLLAPCGEKTIRFCPPIIIKKKELMEGLRIFESSFL